MNRRAVARRLARDTRGATVVEFALVAAPLCVMLCGTLDLGYTAYVRTMVQGALQVAARDAAIGNKNSGQLDADVKTRLGALVAARYVSTAVRSYHDFSRVNAAEKYIDANSNGKYDAGECFEDANDNGVYDAAGASGRANDGGSADEVVAYTITATYPRLLPMGKLIGWSTTNTISATTMLRNQPFASDVSPKWVGPCA